MTDPNSPPKGRGLALRSKFRKCIWDGHKALRSHALLVGKVMFYWNAVHAELLSIFIQVAGERDIKGRIDPAIPTRIWHDQSGDSSQRSILRSFVELRLSRQPEIQDRLLWALDELSTLATYRNDAIHVPFEIEVGRNSKVSLSRPKIEAAQLNRLTRLNSVGHRKLFRALIHDLNYLGDFLWALLARLQYPDPLSISRPLPVKPILRARQLVEKSPPTSNARQENPK